MMLLFVEKGFFFANSINNIENSLSVIENNEFVPVALCKDQVHNLPVFRKSLISSSFNAFIKLKSVHLILHKGISPVFPNWRNVEKRESVSLPNTS